MMLKMVSDAGRPAMLRGLQLIGPRTRLVDADDRRRHLGPRALRRTTHTDFLKDLPARMDEVLSKLRGVTTISKEIKEEMR